MNTENESKKIDLNPLIRSIIEHDIVLALRTQDYRGALALAQTVEILEGMINSEHQMKMTNKFIEVMESRSRGDHFQ